MNQAHDVDDAQMRQAQMELTRILSGLKHEVPIFCSPAAEKTRCSTMPPGRPCVFSPIDRQDRPAGIRPEP
jgi:hypothetical protein